MNAPHGGRLVERLEGERTRSMILEQVNDFTIIDLDIESVKDVHNIAFGTFSPLEGFLCRDDFEHVLAGSRLAQDVPWTIPIILDVDEQFTRQHETGEEILLRDGSSGVVVARMVIEDMYTYSKNTFAKNVFNTTDVAHPGVARLMARRPWLLGGKITLLNEVKSPFAKYHLHPKETRVLFKKKGWDTIVAFQTRNPPHLGHEYIQKTALNLVDGLLINPVIGKKQSGDFTDEVIIASYVALIRNYFVRDTCVMSTFETEMHYAGPKEAIHHAIARKNLGCTHFIVGRDHAGVGSYYGPFEAQDIFKAFPDLNITPVPFRAFYKCTKCQSVVSDKVCPHPEAQQVQFKGRVVRQMLAEGKVPSEEMRPEVAEAIIKHGNMFVP